MARLGQPSNRPRRVLPYAIGAVAAAAIGTAVVLDDKPQETVAAKAIAVSIFGNGFEGDAGGGSPVCPAAPAGFTRVNKTWAQLWAWGWPCGRMGKCERHLRDYPDGQSYPAPIGANKGTYVVVPFVALNDSQNFYFDQAQARDSIGYNPPRPAAGIYFTVTQCPGQFTQVPAHCGIFGNSGALAWTSGSAPGVCHVVAGQTYYFNVIAADPRDGIRPGEHSCEHTASSAMGCDVGARISSGPPL